MSRNVPNPYNCQNEQTTESEQRQPQHLAASGINYIQQASQNSQLSPRSSDSVHDADSFDMKYGAEHVIKLFIPVSLCMLVVVSTINTVTFYTTKDIYLLYTPFHETSTDTFTKTWNAVANSLILIVLVITMTVILIVLYKARCYKIIHGWLIFSTLMLMFLFAFLFFEEVLRAYNMPMDIFTVLLFNWNFGVAGMICIHWKGPLRIQQGYLIFIAALMALVFIKYLPEWTTWMMLFSISIWDIVAVLTPKGPLKILVETAQERNETIFPSLIYSATAYMVNTISDNESEANTSSETRQRSQQETDSDNTRVKIFDPRRGSKTPVTSDDSTTNNRSQISEEVETYGFCCSSCQQLVPELSADNKCYPCQQLVLLQAQRQQQSMEEDKGVKLGLGDFIFYSVLVGKVSSYGDWNVTIACFIAILVGLCVTLLLLVIFKKALPALPISITVGLIFYFATAYIVKPYMDMLLSSQIFV